MNLGFVLLNTMGVEDLVGASAGGPAKNSGG